ncbi:MAG: hypothetical protein RLP02_26785 [Coleofasciculus sp. C2-GNP5-27]
MALKRLLRTEFDDATQDFAGANELLADHPDQTLRETCQYLDRAVSFRSKVSDRKPFRSSE